MIRHVKSLRFAFALLAPVVFVAADAAAARAETATCLSRYRTRSGVTGEFPGSLSMPAGTPCRFERRMTGRARAAGIDVVDAPKHATARPEGRAGLIVTPAKGYTGKDEMVVRFNSGRGASSLVRFAISYY